MPSWECDVDGRDGTWVVQQWRGQRELFTATKLNSESEGSSESRCLTTSESTFNCKV